MKKIAFSIIIILLIIFTSGCGKNHNISKEEQLKRSPVEVIETYFKALKNNDTNEYLSTMSSWDNNWNPDFLVNNVDNIKILSIKRNNDPLLEKMYLRSDRGISQKIDEKNLLIYNVDYEVNFKVERAHKSGIFVNQRFVLIREDENSPWLIDTIETETK